MTLILALGNADQFIQISDRRLSLNKGMIVTDESNKAMALVCADARFLIGFAGLAESKGFSTKLWLLESLYSCAPPDYAIHNIIERIKIKATHDFKTMPPIKLLPPCTKRLSIMFSGFINRHDPPLAAYAILTNYQDFKKGIDEPEAWDEFQTTYWSEIRPHNLELSLVQRIGNWHAMTQYDSEVLRELLEQRKPAHAIIGKAVSLVREMADRSSAFGTIGKQISAICLPRDLKLPIMTSYHTNTVKYNAFYPSLVITTSDKNRHMARDIEVQINDSRNNLMPVAVPKVGRNVPCPCGSGKKYKQCHGRHR
ncbi:MAG: SEC-C metal-binding domain-containing protein [Thermotogota bacterium]|nr:SEC-C metal-binding domain-containing protein [Thermotogota bacterium]